MKKKTTKAAPKRGVVLQSVVGHLGSHTPERLSKMSIGMKKAWLVSPKLAQMRKQTPEFIEKRVSKLRGRKRSAEACEKTASKLRGRKLSPEHRAKLMGRKLSAEHYTKSSKGFLHGFNSLSPAAQEKARKAISKAMTGTHGFGRGARDNPKHHHARHWLVRDPSGVVFEFDNLASWCRANEWRFLDEHPEARLPLWKRAVLGFNGLQRTDGKAGHHWRGWTLVGNFELEQDGSASDTLERTCMSNTEITGES